MLSSIFQILVGMTGIVGYLLKFVGPLTIAPTISLIGLGLFPVAALHNGIVNYVDIESSLPFESIPTSRREWGGGVVVIADRGFGKEFGFGRRICH